MVMCCVLVNMVRKWQEKLCLLILSWTKSLEIRFLEHGWHKGKSYKHLLLYYVIKLYIIIIIIIIYYKVKKCKVIPLQARCDPEGG